MLKMILFSLGLMFTGTIVSASVLNKSPLVVQNFTQATEKGMSFDDLPAFQGFETTEVSPEVAEQLYQMYPANKAQRYINQLNREFTKLQERWPVGANPADFLTLGDFEDSLQLQNLSIGTLFESSGQSLEQTPISEFSLLSKQKLGQLVNNVVQNFTQATEKGMSFDDLPAFQGFETTEVSPEVAEQLYQMYPANKAQRYINQLNREFTKLQERWPVGANPADFLTLGDFEDSLQLQNLSIGTLFESSGQSLEQTPISEFSLLSKQKLGQLVNNVPGLKNQTVGSSPFFQEAMRAGGYNPNRVSSLSIGEVMQAYPQLGRMGLNRLNLDEHTISEIPGIEQMSLGGMSGWQKETIASVPGLSSVPVNQLGANLTGGIVGQIHWVLSDVENPSRTTISGSYEEGFAVPCSQKCAHIEVGTNPLVAGQQWISGRESVNKVSGGEGFLKVMFGGKEPTGRHPFGKGFKVVVWEIDESQGTVSTAWFFRICKKGLGCSPYGIGPIPGFTYSEGDWIFLGL